MHIEFQASKEDYYSFLNYYFFKRNIVRRLAILIIISLWIGSFRSGGQAFILTTFFLKALVVLALLVTFFILLPYIGAKINFNKALKADASSKPRTIIIDSDGLIVKTDDGNIFWKWETLKNAEILNGYLFISLFTKKLYLIPLKSFTTDNEALNFLGVIRSNIAKIKGGNNTRKIKNLYYWGLVGFIPNFGVIAGIVLIIKGIQYSIFKLILIGIADIAFTFLFWMVIFPKINPNGFKDFSQMELNSLVKNVEFYKLQNGQYPIACNNFGKTICLRQYMMPFKWTTADKIFIITIKKLEINIFYFQQELMEFRIQQMIFTHLYYQLTAAKLD